MIETLWQRIQDKGLRAWSSDNVAEVIESEEELNLLIEEASNKFRGVLDAMLIDQENDPNAKETAKRLAKMYILELFEGRFTRAPEATAFPNVGKDAYKGMLVVRAEINSICSHHWAPTRGVAYIGIIPNEFVLGLSKYIRIAQHQARRGTLQESLCVDIANAIQDATKTESIAVYIQETHGCCELRGVRASNSLTQTTILRGEFNNADVKKEFFDNIALQVATNK